MPSSGPPVMTAALILTLCLWGAMLAAWQAYIVIARWRAK